MRTIILSVITGYLSASSFGQIPESTEIDQIFSRWNKPHSPGCAVGVFKNGELVYKKGYGAGNLEHNIPLTSTTLFYIGSTAKQFVAFSILLLEEEGKLSLHDEIQKYLPDFPRYEKPITIRHLIHHTSGLRDYSTLWDLRGKNYLDHMPDYQVYALIKKQNVLNFPPGEQYLYSNSGYFLLGLIVEAASGQSLKEFAKENIFDPLAMNSTVFLDDNRQIIRNRAFSYERKPGGEGFHNIIRRFDLVGSGGVYTNIEDLFLWDQNFYNNKLGKSGQEIINKMYENGVLNNGESTGYAFGLVNNTHHGLRTISHGGSHAGFRAQLLRFPALNFSVAVLANLSEIKATTLAYQIADGFLNDRPKTDAVVPDKQLYQNTISLDRKKLARLTGNYINKNGDKIRKIVMVNDTLHYYRSPTSQDKLLPVGGAEFKMMRITGPDVKVKFDEGENTTLSYISDGKVKSVMHRYESVTYSKEELSLFQGNYYSPEINTSYQLNMKADDLVLFVNHREISPLTVVTKNTLSNDPFGIFYFEKGPSNGISGFKLSISRVLKLQFIKE